MLWLCGEKKKFLSEKLDKTAICKLANNIKLIPLTKKINFSSLIYTGTAQHFLTDTKHTQNVFCFTSKQTYAIHKATVSSNKDSLNIKQEGFLLLPKHRPF